MATNHYNKVMLVLMNGASYGIAGLQICPLCGFTLLLQPHLVPAVSQHLRHAPAHQHMASRSFKSTTTLQHSFAACPDNTHYSISMHQTVCPP